LAQLVLIVNLLKAKHRYLLVLYHQFLLPMLAETNDLYQFCS